MKTLVTIAFCLISFSHSHALITKRYNDEAHCQLFEALDMIKDQEGHYHPERELYPNEEIVSRRTLYGFSLRELKFDLTQERINAKLYHHITLGLDTYKEIFIDMKSKKLEHIISFHNRSLALADQYCLRNHELINMSQNP